MRSALSRCPSHYIKLTITITLSGVPSELSLGSCPNEECTQEWRFSPLPSNFCNRYESNVPATPRSKGKEDSFDRFRAVQATRQHKLVRIGEDAASVKYGNLREKHNRVSGNDVVAMFGTKIRPRCICWWRIRKISPDTGKYLLMNSRIWPVVNASIVS